MKSAQEVTPAVTQAAERGIHFFIVDAPAEAFRPLATAVRGREIMLFNATAPDDWLRRDLCAREIVHTLPSLAMTSDALMQHLVSRKWRDILVLQGPLPPIRDHQGFENWSRSSVPASLPTARSSPALIRASASRTIRCCSRRAPATMM